MLMMVRQQMICIIAPDWPGGADLLRSDDLSTSLNKLFCDVGVVHFASIALLPPMADARNPLPSMMLELAVEEGLRPYDLLVRLIDHPSGAMWSLYSAYWPEGQSPHLASQRNQELLERLMKWHHVADGAFVGARDRSVKQVKKEGHLLERTRAEARALKAKHGEDRASFALALARWAFGNRDLEWATEPAPRSFWRGSRAGVMAYLIVIVGLAPAIFWLVGALSRLLARADAWLFSRASSTVQTAFYALSETSEWVLGIIGRFLFALAVLAFAPWIFFIALPALFAPWRKWLESLSRELDRPTETWSSLSTYFGVWIVGAPLVLATIWYVLIYMFKPDHLFEATNALWIPAIPGWRQILICASALLMLLVIGALLSPKFDRLVSKLRASGSIILTKTTYTAPSKYTHVHPRLARLDY